MFFMLIALLGCSEDKDSLNKSLLEATLSLNGVKMDQLIKKGADVDSIFAKTSGGIELTLLEHVYNTDIPFKEKTLCCELLLLKGANPDIKFAIGEEYLLHNLVALQNKDEALFAVIGLLHNWNADVNKRDKGGGRTALYHAIFNGREGAGVLEIVQYLIYRGADTNIKMYTEYGPKTIIEIVQQDLMIIHPISKEKLLEVLSSGPTNL